MGRYRKKAETKIATKAELKVEPEAEPVEVKKDEAVPTVEPIVKKWVVAPRRAVVQGSVTLEEGEAVDENIVDIESLRRKKAIVKR